MSDPPPPPTTVPDQFYLTLQQIAATQQYLAQLLQQQTEQPPKTTIRLKLAEPDDFNGTVSGSMSFLQQCELYAAGNDLEDKQQILMALSHMKKGAARAWAARLFDLMQRPNNKDDNPFGPVVPRTWDAFKTEFLLAFGDPNRQLTAQQRIKHLTLGNKTADEYIVAFEELEEDTKYNEEALIDFFKTGIIGEYLDQIYKMSTIPTSLHEYKNLLRRFYAHNRENRVFVASHRPQKTNWQSSRRVTTSDAQSSQPAKASDQVVPMEVDRSNTRRPTPWRRPLICYKCRQQGHMARNCPNMAINLMDMDYEQIKAHILAEEKKNTPKEDF